MKLVPYWLDTAEPSGDYRRTPVPEHVDVAIIGAGFTGLSAAVEFAKQGASVAVFERHTVGWGASGRNGGMATTGLAIGFSTAVKRYGASDVLWGRVRPAAGPTEVTIQHKVGKGRWKRLTVVPTNGVYGLRSDHRKAQRYRARWRRPAGGTITGPAIRAY